MKKKNNIYHAVLSLAVPMMIQNGITNAVGLVDNLMVGSLGTESMTAVSIAGQLIFVFNLAIFGGLSGPGIYGAQYYGQGNEEGVKNVFRLKWWIALCITFVGMGLLYFARDFFISLYLRGEGDGIDPILTLELSKEYLEIMLIGFVPFFVTQVYAGSLRETGESMKPMIAGVASVVTDVLFNWLLIYGKFGLPALGVRGAAIATVISRVVELLIIVIWSTAQKAKHTFLIGVYKTMRVPSAMSDVIIKKSLPIFLNEFLWAGGMAAITQCYSVRGLTVVAGMNISNAICNLLNVVFIAMGNAVGIITGQKLGASKYEEAKNDSLKLMRFTGGLCFILTFLLFAFASKFPDFYDTSSEVKHYGTMFIRITALFFPLQGYLNALYFTLRSGGKTLITFLFDSVFTWVFPVAISFLLCNKSALSIYTIFVLVQMMDVVKVAIGYVLIRKGIWINNLVENGV